MPQTSFSGPALLHTLAASQSLDGRCFRNTRDAGWTTGDSWWCCDRNKHWAVTHKQQPDSCDRSKHLLPHRHCWQSAGLSQWHFAMSALKGHLPQSYTLPHSFSRHSVEETRQRRGRPRYSGSIPFRVTWLFLSPELVQQLVIQRIDCKTKIRIWTTVKSSNSISWQHEKWTAVMTGQN